MIVLLLIFVGSAGYAYEDLYANDGTYLGNTNTDRYDENSIHNQYGKHGNPYNRNSINNPYGPYGNQYSSTSPRNEYAQPGTAKPLNGGIPRDYGGASNQY